jgi:thiol-disulfide isomerase/thioredoxin
MSTVHFNLNGESSQQELDNFINYLDTKEGIVLVHADWCGHCRNLRLEKTSNGKSEWTNFVEEAKGKINILEIEMDAYNKVKNKMFAVSGYPYIASFKRGNVEEYDGSRTSESLLEFMNLTRRTGGARRSRKNNRRNRSRVSKKRQCRRNRSRRN